MKTVSLLGTGWLGLSLGKALHADGWRVHATTTQPGKCDLLAKEGFTPHLLEVGTPPMGEVGEGNPRRAKDACWDSDTIIVTLPFRRNFVDPFVYVAQMREILRSLLPHQQLLFTSSTSYYPDCDHEVDEDLSFSPIAPRLRALAEAEAVIMSHAGPTTVLRLGGLYGPDRPVHSFATRGLAKHTPHSRVNLIHRDDVIGIVMTMMRGNHWGHVWNAVSDGHPTRAALYDMNSDTVAGGKMVSNRKLKIALNYHFCYPAPLTLV